MGLPDSVCFSMLLEIPTNVTAFAYRFCIICHLHLGYKSVSMGFVHSFLKICYLTERQGGKEREDKIHIHIHTQEEREKGEQIFHLLVHFQNGHSGWDGFRPKSGTWNSILVSYLHNRIQALHPSSMASRFIHRKLNWEYPGLEPAFAYKMLVS